MGRLLITTPNVWAWTRLSNRSLIYMNYTKMCRVRGSQHQAKNHHSGDEVKMSCKVERHETDRQIRLQQTMSDP